MEEIDKILILVKHGCSKIALIDQVSPENLAKFFPSSGIQQLTRVR